MCLMKQIVIIVIFPQINRWRRKSGNYIDFKSEF